MGVSTSLYSGLSGIKAHQRRMDVIGHNIANVNTPGFRSSQALFRTAFAQTLSIGTAPTAGLGGVNPVQVGLGTTVGATRTNFNQGSIETTGVPSDLAISGNGFFIVQDGSGRPYYTRDGSFSLGADQVLTNSKGMRVLGWMADENFQITQSGAGESITIPIGSMRLAMATQNIHLTGNLNSNGTIGTQGSLLGTQGLIDNSTGLAATAGTLLTDLTDGGRLDLILDAILSMLDDARAEPGQGAPPVNPDAMTKIDYLYKQWRNLTKNDGSDRTLYNDAGDTVDQKSSVSEAAGTVSVGKWVSGP